MSPSDRLAAALREIGERCEKATPTEKMEFTRYDHGGGRAFCPGEDRTYEGRQLVMDTYHEADREFYFGVRQDVPRLLAVVREMQAALENAVIDCDEIQADDSIEPAEARAWAAQGRSLRASLARAADLMKGGEG